MFGLIVDCFLFFFFSFYCFFNQAIDSDRKRKELREQTQCVTNSIGNNDFDYEDKQKTQDSIPVYEGLHFNLTAEHSKNTFFSPSVKSKLIIVCYCICLCNIYSPLFFLFSSSFFFLLFFVFRVVSAVGKRFGYLDHCFSE